MEEKLIRQTGFNKFCRLRTRKRKVPPASSFGCRMLVPEHYEESDLTPDVFGVGYIECTEESCHFIASFRYRECCCCL